MGVLDRFEKGIERAVSGANAKAFRSEVQPVEIASALRRECDDRIVVVGRDRTLAPNTFVVELGPADHERIGEWQDALGDEFRAVVEDHALQQRYAFVGPVSVGFEEADDLDTGVFRIRSSMTKSSAARPAQSAEPASPPLPPPPGRHGSPGDASSVLLPPDEPWAVEAPGAEAPLPPHPGTALPPPGTMLPSARTRPDLPPTAVPILDIDGQSYPLAAGVTVLGRSSEADITLDDPGVSRRHAEIRIVDGRPRLVDLGSTNGTYLDGERVTSAYLSDGSQITMGRTRMVLHAGRW